MSTPSISTTTSTRRRRSEDDNATTITIHTHIHSPPTLSAVSESIEDTNQQGNHNLDAHLIDTKTENQSSSSSHNHQQSKRQKRDNHDNQTETQAGTSMHTTTSHHQHDTLNTEQNTNTRTTHTESIGISPHKEPIIEYHDSFDRNELNCIVCLDQQPGIDIMQCENGHLMCKTCWRKIVDSDKSKCPCCNTRLNRDKPLRNRFAEVVLANLFVECTNQGCHMKIKNHEITKHTSQQCNYRIVHCKYYLLGCDWHHPYIGYCKHIKECEYKNKKGSKCLKFIEQRLEQQRTEYEQYKHGIETQLHTCRMLSKRCRDMSIRDVVIERDPLTPHILCSKVFKAIGMSWEVYLSFDYQPTVSNNSNNNNTSSLKPINVKLYLKVISPILRRTTIEIFIVSGPSLDYQLVPTLRHFVFKRRMKQSEPFVLPFTVGQVNELIRMDSINFRIGFLDVSAGRVQSSFTTINRTTISDSDDEDGEGSDESDMDEHHHHRRHHHHHHYEHDDYDPDDDDDTDSESDIIHGDVDEMDSDSEEDDYDSEHDHQGDDGYADYSGDESSDYDDGDFLPSNEAVNVDVSGDEAELEFGDVEDNRTSSSHTSNTDVVPVMNGGEYIGFIDQHGYVHGVGQHLQNTERHRSIGRAAAAINIANEYHHSTTGESSSSPSSGNHHHGNTSSNPITLESETSESDSEGDNEAVNGNHEVNTDNDNDNCTQRH